eukprot:TRINITY_DN36016_c0_g1_i1.p1 TRINITY_DN36016_c0_g1~~TRINITY_DN36016_c0_g1_i1.p1  ORF type:complete len:1333 (+),score=443.44 TRINITY_DN36016_c0_g1_i1:228-4001(+)
MRVRVSDPKPHEAGHVEYTVSLLQQDRSEIHRVVRRFTDFQHMAQKLEQHQKATGGRPPPANTPRAHNFLAGKFNQDWLEERTAQLQAYLDKVWTREDLMGHPDISHLTGYDEWAKIWADTTISQLEAEWKDHSRRGLDLLEQREREGNARMLTLHTSAQYGNAAVTLSHLQSVLGTVRSLRGSHRCGRDGAGDLPPRLRRLVGLISECKAALEESDVTSLDFSPVEARLRDFLQKQAAVRAEVSRDPAICSSMSFGAPIAPRTGYGGELKRLISARDDASEGAVDGAFALRETVQRRDVEGWLQRVTGELLPAVQCELALLGGDWPPKPDAGAVKLDTPGDNLFGLYGQSDEPAAAQPKPNVVAAAHWSPAALMEGVSAAVNQIDDFLADERRAADEMEHDTEDRAQSTATAAQDAFRSALLDQSPAEFTEVPERMRQLEVAADREILSAHRFAERCAQRLPEIIQGALQLLLRLLQYQAVMCASTLDRSRFFGTLADQSATQGAAAQKSASDLYRAEENTERIKSKFLDAQDKERRARTLGTAKAREQHREDAKKEMRAVRGELQQSLYEERRLRIELEKHAATMPEVLSLYPVLTTRGSHRFELDFFEIENQLDRGRHVILRTTFNGQKHALKEFNLFSAGAKETFEREAARLAAMRHPHIIPIEAVMYDAESRKGYLLFQYFEHGNLQKWLAKDGPDAPTFKERVEVCVQVLLSIFHLHRQEIVHGDIKLENVLIASDAEQTVAVLADYDVARVNDRRQPYSNPDSVLPSFASPECSDPQCFAGPEADMWAFGCLLIVALVGRLEFNGSEMGCLVSLNDLSELHGRLEADQIEHLRALLDRLLQAEPQDRLTSLAALQHPFFMSFESNDVTQRLHVAGQVRELLADREAYDCGPWDTLTAATTRQRAALFQATGARVSVGDRAAQLHEQKAACQVDAVLERAAVDEQRRRHEDWAPLDHQDMRCEEDTAALCQRFAEVQSQAAALVHRGAGVWDQVCEAVKGCTACPITWESDGRVPQLTELPISDGPAAQLKSLLPPRLRLSRLFRHEDRDAWQRFQEARDALRLVRGVKELPKMRCATDAVAAEVLSVTPDEHLNEKMLFLTLPFNPLPCSDLSPFAEPTPYGHGLLLHDTVQPTAAEYDSGGTVSVLVLRSVLGRPCLAGSVKFRDQPVAPSPWPASAVVAPHAAPTCTPFDCVVAEQAAGDEPRSPRSGDDDAEERPPPRPSSPAQCFKVCGRRGVYYADYLMECSVRL